MEVIFSQSTNKTKIRLNDAIFSYIWPLVVEDTMIYLT